MGVASIGAGWYVRLLEAEAPDNWTADEVKADDVHVVEAERLIVVGISDEPLDFVVMTSPRGGTLHDPRDTELDTLFSLAVHWQQSCRDDDLGFGGRVSGPWHATHRPQPDPDPAEHLLGRDVALRLRRVAKQSAAANGAP